MRRWVFVQALIGEDSRSKKYRRTPVFDVEGFPLRVFVAAAAVVEALRGHTIKLTLDAFDHIVRFLRRNEFSFGFWSNFLEHARFCNAREF